MLFSLKNFIWHDFFHLCSVAHVISVNVLMFFSVRHKLTRWLVRAKADSQFLVSAAVANTVMLIYHNAVNSKLLPFVAIALLFLSFTFTLVLFRLNNSYAFMLQFVYLVFFTWNFYYQQSWILPAVCYLLLVIISKSLINILFEDFAFKITLVYVLITAVSAAAILYMVNSRYASLMKNNFNRVRLAAHRARMLLSDDTLLKIPITTKEFEEVLSNPTSPEADLYLKVFAKAFKAKRVYFASFRGNSSLAKDLPCYQKVKWGNSCFSLSHSDVYVAIPVWKDRKVIGALIYEFSPTFIFSDIAWDRGWFVADPQGHIYPKEVRNILSLLSEQELRSYKEDKVLCPSTTAYNARCSLLMKVSFGEDLFIGRMVPLKDLVNFKATVFWVWLLIALFGNLFFFELHRWSVLTITDPLTGLLNRRGFFKRSGRKLANAMSKKVCFHLLMLDLDDFKNINDTYGHSVGDAVLEHAAMALRSSVKERDIVARVGGEEMVIASTSYEKEDGHFIAERIRKKLESSPLTVSGQKIPVTVSIGVVSVYSDTDKGIDLDAEEAEVLLHKVLNMADERMYEAKRRGKNCTVSTIVELGMIWGGRGESNPQPPEPQSGALTS